MNINDLGKLISLASIWGGSFIFMRVLAPILGPVPTAFFRVFIAGIVLSMYFSVTKHDVNWKKHWKHYFAIGAINSAIPFLLFSIAALYIPASLSVIINSSAPLFVAIFAAIWLGEKLTSLKLIGLTSGIIGVTIITFTDALSIGLLGLMASLACVLAAICYALAGIYIKKISPFLEPMAIAGASQLAAGILLAPALIFFPIKGVINFDIILNILGLSLLCSAVAYILYYQLIENIGPTKALTVTFLMPVFGIAWGVIFLKEAISVQMIVGGIFILIGTWVVLKKKK